MIKSEKRMLRLFLFPIVVFYLVIYLYPTLRAFFMTMFVIPGVSAPFELWSFAGLKNFREVFSSPLFRTSFSNMVKILVYGGLGNFVIALFFSYLLSKRVRFGKFLKAAIYLPNVITPVAMVVVWVHYVFNNQFGLLKNVFSFLGLDALAAIPWTSAQFSFASMLIAFCFGGIGYYMVTIMAAMEKVPRELYESFELEGAGEWKIYTRLTLPLIRDTLKTAVIFWNLGCINFFLWSRVFSVNPLDPTTLTPANYMYGLIFGANIGGNSMASNLNVGLGAVVGVVLCLCAVMVFLVCDLLFGKEKYEY